MRPFRSALFQFSGLVVALGLLGLLAVAAFAQGRAGVPATSGRARSRFSGRVAEAGSVQLQFLAKPPRMATPLSRTGNGTGGPEQFSLPPVPEGPFVEAAGELSLSRLSRERAGKGDVRTQANTDSVSVDVLTSLTAAAHNNALSVVLSPSTASNGNVVMYTGNSFAALSTDGGESFAYVNPAAKFPASDGGFSGNQVLQYFPSIDRFVWLLQYAKNGSSQNRVRLGLATTAQAAAGTWGYTDISSGNLSLGNQWLDASDLGFSAGHLYLTANIRTAADNFSGTLCLRMALSDLADGGGVSFDGFDVEDVSTLRASMGTGTRAFIAAHLSTSSLRVYHWDDASSLEVEHSVTVPSWANGPYSSLTPGGYNWLGRIDSRITAATVVGGEVWFGWTAAAGGSQSLPHPYANIVRVHGTSFAFVSDSPSLAYEDAAAAYPALSTNANSEVGISCAVGGGGAYDPTTVLGFRTGGDQRNFPFVSATHGPQAQAWGDRLAVRVDGQNAKLFSATGYALVGGSTDSAVVPRYVHFGRASDLDGLILNDIYEPDNTVGTAKPIAVGETQFRNIDDVGDQDFATFTLAAPALTTVQTDGVAGDTVMYLYGPDNSATHLETDDDDGNGEFSLITRPLAAGTYWVRIEEFGNNEPISAYSLSLTAVALAMQVTAPNGGETYVTGSSQTITWTSANVTGNVKLEYSSNGGSAWSTLVADTPNDGSQAWTVPNTPTAQGQVRVSTVDDTISDSSDANFAVVNPSLTVISPNGGETWGTGSNHAVTWNSVGVSGNVLLEYSTNAGGSWTTIAASTANDGTYDWTVPNTLTTQGRVRVTSVTTPAINDQSNGNFTLALPASITITSPNGGETLVAGTVHTVTWNSNNVVGNVQVQFSSTGGTNPTFIADTANNGSYSWTVPETATTQGRMRITTLNGSAADLSDANFTIAVPTLTVTAPNGGEQYVAGTVQTLTWTSSHVTGNVKLEYSGDGGNAWNTLAADTPNDGSEEWTVPNVGTAQGRIRISALNGSAADLSNGTFTVLVPTLTVTAPNGGETYVVGSAQTITWTSTNMVGGVQLQFSNDDGTSWSAFANTANDGSESWTVPDSTVTQARIRVTALDVVAADTSDANFSIVVPSLTVTAPNGGEQYVAGSAQTVTWTSAYVTGNVKLAFSSDGGATWSTVAANTANDGSEGWSVPNLGTTQGLIRITAVDGSATDTSNSNFTVLVPTLTVTAPNGGEGYPANTARTLTWTSSNVAGNVKLEYSGDGGASWSVLNASTANDGTEGWITPGTPTVQARIRVSAVAGSASDVSNANFAVTYVGGILKAPAKLNFGTVKKLKPKTVKAVIENKSKTANLVVSFGVSGAPFSITGGTGPFTILPKKKLTVYVLFAPQAVGSLGGTLTVTSSDPANPSKAIGLTGKAR